MTAVMIGVDPHKASHTAVAIDGRRSRWASCGSRLGRPRPGGWWRGRRKWPERTWAVVATRGRTW